MNAVKRFIAFSGALLLSVFSLSLAFAQDSEGSNVPFTAEQAESGSELYAAHCAACHGGELEGMASFPALKGDAFQGEWGAQGLEQLHVYIMENMPLGQAGVLTEEEYLDVLSLILSHNGVEAGETELTADIVADYEFPAAQ